MKFISTILAFSLILGMIIPVGSAYGHGLGLDKISGINADGKKISITVELPQL